MNVASSERVSRNLAFRYTPAPIPGGPVGDGFLRRLLSSPNFQHSAMIPICHVQLLPLLSGVQRAMLDIFKYLDRERYAPHVVCQQPGPLSAELARLDIPCHFVGSLRRQIHPLRDARALQMLVALFRRHRFRLVHTHSSKPGILGRVAARRAGVPRIVHHVHSFAFHEFSPRWQTVVYSNIERWASQFCDRVIVVNQEERELAVRRGIVPAEKCLTVYNGVDLERFKPDRETWRGRMRCEYGLRPHDTVILFMGRLDVPKQPLILPRIAAALELERPADDWRMLIVGSGPMRERFEREIIAHRVGRRFVLVDWQDEPQRVYQAADIWLQPSLWEGLSLTLLEAHASALPCVASNVKGNREVVVPQAGKLCEPQDAAQYAMELARLIDDRELRQRMGVAARCRAEERFDSRDNMKWIGALYDQLLESVNEPLGHRYAA